MIDLTPATVASCPVITGKGLLSLPYPTPFNDEMIPKLIGSYGDKTASTYMDNGQLIVPSGQTSFSQIATLRWDGSTAQARMDNLLRATK
jgi:hypothetical protein